METWLVVSFPVPPGTGGTFQFGIVAATNEDEARQLVLDQLKADGVETKGIDPKEIGLMNFQAAGDMANKGYLYHG